MTSLLDMVNEVRALVKDLLPKPTERPKAEAIPETPTVPDPTSSKSVVEGKDQLSHFKMVLSLTRIYAVSLLHNIGNDSSHPYLQMLDFPIVWS